MPDLEVDLDKLAADASTFQHVSSQIQGMIGPLKNATNSAASAAGGHGLAGAIHDFDAAWAPMLQSYDALMAKLAVALEHSIADYQAVERQLTEMFGPGPR